MITVPRLIEKKFCLFSRSLSSAANTLDSTAVLGWGSGSQGVLGQGNLIPHDFYQPIQIPNLPRDVIGVGAGSHHSLAWTSEGQLFTWGRNNESQLGRKLAENEFEFGVTPGAVEIKKNKQVTYATGSGVATFLITKDGELLVSGGSKRGQLGLGPEKLKTENFTAVPFPHGSRVLQIAAGWGHALALVEDGNENETKVYSWGWPQQGVLGHSFASSIEDELEENLYRRCVYYPKEIELLKRVRISSVGACMDASYCITQDGRLLSFGKNDLGQLGRQSKDEFLAPKDASDWEVQIPRRTYPDKNVKFRKLAPGLAHCLAVSQGGHPFAWGWNGSDQCGLNNTDDDKSEFQDKPMPIFGVAQNRFALIAAGRTHSVLITDDIVKHDAQQPRAFGKTWPCLTMTYTFGSSSNGRLGTDTYEDAPFPELVPALDGEMVLDVAAGLDHTLVLIGRDQAASRGGPLTSFDSIE